MSKGSQSPKSPYIMTRISPKSPYIMAAKSPKSPMLHEKYKAGCAWGLISIFNFRQDRSSKKLISDRRGLDRHSTGNRHRHTRNKHNVLPGVDEKCELANDGPRNQTLLLEYPKENVKSFKDKDKVKKHRTERKSVNGCKDASVLGHMQPCRHISVDELLHKLDSSAKTSSSHNHHKHGLDKKDNDFLDSKQLTQMDDLAEAYVNQKFINGKFFSGDGPSSQSKQVLDALQILNSNKELFLKLLQDPNSLLVKHIEELRDAQAKQVTRDAKLQDYQAIDAMQSGEPIRAKKFWREKIKFQESYPPRGAEDPQSSNEIVVLKPGPLNSQTTQSCEDGHCSSLRSHYQETEEQRTKHTSFTLGGIRRKLKHVVGVSKKEQKQIPIKNRLYKTSSDCQENKRLQNEKKDDSLSPLSENLEIPSLIDCKKPNDQMQISESRPRSLENPLSETKGHESIRSYTDNVCSTGSQRIVAANNSKRPEEINLLEVHAELKDIGIAYDDEHIITSNSCSENESSELSRLDSPPSESESSSSNVSSSALLSIKKVEDVNIKDGAEQPSPVSVLEQFCIEDISSPANIASHSAELPVKPEQISFEEHYSPILSPRLDFQRTLSTSMNDQGSLTDYVRSVVQAVSLDWDELSLKCNFSDQLLDPSIYDEFGVSCSDHGLLFDCINETLLQVYQCYFKSSPWVSCMKPKIRPFSVEEHVVHEVVKSFDCYLLPQSQTLEHLSETDLAKSISWMDIRIDAEDTVTDVTEGVLDELIMETLSQLQS